MNSGMNILMIKTILRFFDMLINHQPPELNMIYIYHFTKL